MIINQVQNNIKPEMVDNNKLLRRYNERDKV